MVKSQNTKNIIIAGIVVIVILLAVKLMFFPKDISSEKTITASGTAEIIATPDLAEIYANIEVLEPTAQEAEEKSKEISEKVLELAKGYEDVKVETLSYNIYKREDWTERGRIFKGYTATYSLKLSTEDFAQVGKVVDEIVAEGVNNINNIQFTLSLEEQEKIKAEALKQATSSAKLKAESIADGLGVKLGNIVSVSESGFFPRPYMLEKAAVDEVVATSQDTAELTFEPRDITVTATISVVYGIN